ncbi:MAG: hypothetical protein M3314_15935, partial [Actinomycetota bacterium]|nr:hypothetical protein [Actinomycetota bacterium]
AYFANPNRALRSQSADDMLGFGAPSMVALTPYALVIAAEIIEVLTREGADVSALVGPVSDAAVPAVPPLSPEQLDRVRELSLQKARQLDLDEDKAALLAEALTGSLAPQPS